MKRTIHGIRGVIRDLALNNFAAAESEQNGREQIRRGADEEIKNAGDDRAERADEILRRPVRRREMTARHPRRQVFRIVGNQREKKQRPDAEQNDGEDFIPRRVFLRSCHRGE